MRAFVKLRQMLEANEQLNRKFAAVIRKLAEHDTHFRTFSMRLGSCLPFAFTTFGKWALPE